MELLMQAEIFSLTGRGHLKVTYWWMGSALNCPADAAPYYPPFIWNVHRIDDQHVALSPSTIDAEPLPPLAFPVYASVRSDRDNYVQMQEPGTSNFVSWVQAFETLTFQWKDLLVATFRDQSGRYLGLADAVDERLIGDFPVIFGNRQHRGYRIRSEDEVPTLRSLWFVRNVKMEPYTTSLLALDTATNDLGARIQAAALAHGVSVSLDELAPLLEQVG